MGEVLSIFGDEEDGEREPDEVLQEAMGKLDDVVVIGIDLNGEGYYRASTTDAAAVVLLLRRCEWAIHRWLDGDE